MPAPKDQTPTLKKLYASAGLDPGMVQSWSDQSAGLLGQYGDTMSLLKVDRARMLDAFRQQKRDIATQKRTDYRSVAGASNDRGVLGSSADVTARQDVLSGAASAKLAAKDEYSQGLVQNQSSKLQARRDLMMAMSSLEGQKAAARAAAGNNAYLTGLLDDLVNTGGGGGGPRGAGSGLNAANRGRWMRKLAGAKGIYGLANRVESLAGGLFDVSELERGGAPINSGHSVGSDHYSGKAFDVNVTRNNNTDFETKKLKALAAVLSKLYGKQQHQVYGKWNDPKGHPTHLHWSALMKRWGKQPTTGNAGGIQ